MDPGGLGDIPDARAFLRRVMPRRDTPHPDKTIHSGEGIGFQNPAREPAAPPFLRDRRVTFPLILND